MKRILLVLATIVAAVLMVGGVALAATKIGTDGPDTLMGTKGSDALSGRGGTDWIDGRAGNDVIRGGPGNDDPLSSRPIGILDGGGGADSYRVDRASTCCSMVRCAKVRKTSSRAATATTI